jgi:hypothetical protein
MEGVTPELGYEVGREKACEADSVRLPRDKPGDDTDHVHYDANVAWDWR